MPATSLHWVPTAEMLGDDAEVEMKRKVPDALAYADDEFVSGLLKNLSAMRVNKQFCDVILVVGKQEICGHRCVLAGSSQYLLKLFNGEGERRLSQSDRTGQPARDAPHVYQLSDKLDPESTETLVQFAYTGKLYVHPTKVRSLYTAAVRLKMEKVAQVCAEWLVNNLATSSCLEIRSIPGVVANTKLVRTVDQFIEKHFDEMVSTKQLLKLPQVKVELLTPALEEVTCDRMSTQALLVLDWLRKYMMEENLALDDCAEKLYLLYMNADNSLHDCTDIVSGDSANTELVQDYKKLSKKLSRKQMVAVPQREEEPQQQQQQQRVRPRSQERLLRPKPAAVPAFTAGAADTPPVDEEYDWKTIACSKTDERGMAALVTIGGRLAVLSVRQRLNTPSPSGSPRSRRPASGEQPDTFSALPELSSAKCATGVGNINDKLIICGGYDRGECLRDVELYDPVTNEIRSICPMLAARGRFDLTVVDGRPYAIGGCDGNNELASVEMYCEEEDKWLPRAPLHIARSNLGVCTLNGKIYCIGGWNGKFGSRKCDVYDPKTNKWAQIASMKVGRYQAAVTALDGLVYAAGGCDSWNCLSSVEVYDPEEDRWSTIPPMSTPRRGCGISKINGKLIVIGGSDGVQSLNTSEIYDPEERTWSPGPKMTCRRNNVNVAVAGGKLFAVGGFSGKQFLNTMEFLDPATMRWTTCIPRRWRATSGSSTGSEECPQALPETTAESSSTSSGTTSTVLDPTDRPSVSQACA